MAEPSNGASVHGAHHVVPKPQRPRIYKVLTEFTSCKYEANHELVHPEKYKLVAQVVMPTLLSDPSHWGHVARQFCEYMDGHSK